MNIQLFVATKAFIVYKGKVLIIRESGTYTDGTNSGKYDVVGGRVKPGEKFDESLKREVTEETGLEVTIEKPVHVGEWRPIVREEQWQIVGIFFVCRATSSDVTLSEDHAEYQWIDPKEYMNYPLIDNLKPVFEAYLEYERKQ